MNALRFAQKGAIESVLKLEQVPKPSLTSGEALVRVKAAGINGVRSKWLISRVFLTGDRDSPIALGSKVGSPLPPSLAFPAGTSLERWSTFSTNPPKSGSERRFGELGEPGASRSMEPTRSEFLSVCAGAHLVDAQRRFKVHESKGGGVEQEAQSFGSHSSGQPRSLPCLRVDCCPPPLGGQADRQRPRHR